MKLAAALSLIVLAVQAGSGAGGHAPKSSGAGALKWQMPAVETALSDAESSEEARWTEPGWQRPTDLAAPKGVRSTPRTRGATGPSNQVRVSTAPVTAAVSERETSRTSVAPSAGSLSRSETAAVRTLRRQVADRRAAQLGGGDARDSRSGQQRRSESRQRVTRRSAALVASLRRTISERRTATWNHQRVLGLARTKTAYRERGTRSVPYLRWLRQLWAVRADRYYRLSLRTLRDFPFCDGCHAWHRAVEDVQRVFPGTSGWLLSCSAAEGGHGRWVGYSGVPYSTWLRDSDTVGGPLQFRYSTFKGMFRRGADYVYAHGYRMPQFVDYTAAWRSALGQAVAGGWARYTGNDDSHWSASFGRGC